MNWAFMVRVGLIMAIIAALVGYAAYSTYQILVKKGISGDRVELFAISSFEMNQRHGTIADIPPAYRALDGKKIWLEGEVKPNTFMVSGSVTRFEICYSVQKCCFSGEPKAQHFVACTLSGGQKIRVGDADRVRVYGTLHVKVIRDEGGLIQSVYQMDVERAEPA